MILDILPWTGLGPLRFGMTPGLVQHAFHEKQEYEDWMGANVSDSMFYRGLIFGFDAYGTDGRPDNYSHFCSVSARARDDLRLFGRQLGAWSRNELLAFATEREWLTLDGEEGDLDFVDLHLEVGFDSNERVDSVGFGLPGIKLFIVERVRRPMAGYEVSFLGCPLSRDLKCLRSGSRWRYHGPLRTLEERSHEGFLERLERFSILCADDVLVPVGPGPRVPRDGSGAPDQH